MEKKILIVGGNGLGRAAAEAALRQKLVVEFDIVSAEEAASYFKDVNEFNTMKKVETEEPLVLKNGTTDFFSDSKSSRRIRRENERKAKKKNK